MRFSNRWGFAVAGFACGILVAGAIFYLAVRNEGRSDFGLAITETDLYIFHDQIPADLKRHRDLARDLANGTLADFPNTNTTPPIGFGEWEEILEPGKGLVFVRRTYRDIKNATDALTGAKLLLYLPAPPDPAGQVFRFENGYNPEGALLFVTDRSYAWNWRKIGYPTRGQVYIQHDEAHGYLVQIGVEYQYADYANFKIGNDKYASGWRDAGACSTPFRWEMIRFRE